MNYEVTEQKNGRKSYSALVETNNALCIIKVKERPMPGRNGSWREYSSKPRLYFFASDWNVFEDFVERGRYNRPHQWYRAELLFPVQELLEELGIEFEKANWSQKAGCSCGCSPGFILTVEKEYSQMPFDVFVDFEKIEN